jgi:hypothetical protein
VRGPIPSLCQQFASDNSGRRAAAFLQAAGYRLPISMSSCEVRISCSQNEIWDAFGFWLFSKKCASTSRRIIGQSLSRCVFLAFTKSGSESKSQRVPSESSMVVRRFQSAANASTPRIFDMTSTRMRGDSGVMAAKVDDVTASKKLQAA